MSLWEKGCAMTAAEISEVLVVSQGFENKTISNFSLDDFRRKKLPNFPKPGNIQYRAYYRIEKYEPGSRCPWGYSRWTTSENGKLKMLDSRWDSS